ncbi:PASTA domain-containing protein [Gordonia sp. CPCC 206044]|uniref:PASTA domain-containing protein n=1 Tax=Gordonia sp. CPCC 206044 TaxID=3140793 RepID=UPI003AF3CCB6
MMRRIQHFAISTVIGVGVTISITSCSGADEPQATTTLTSTATETVAVDTQRTTVEATTPIAAPPVTETASAQPQESSAIMPDVVCLNLQDAQNKIQDAGVFFSRSADATGQGRSQILDRNWVVVAQTPQPGTPFGEGDAVLSAVKIGEPSPC